MEILQLTKLTNLFLSDNELDIFPVAVCHLLMLESLDLSRNEIPVCFSFTFSFFSPFSPKNLTHPFPSHSRKYPLKSIVWGG